MQLEGSVSSKSQATKQPCLPRGDLVKTGPSKELRKARRLWPGLRGLFHGSCSAMFGWFEWMFQTQVLAENTTLPTVTAKGKF